MRRRRPGATPRGREGFTLIELMIAMIILTIGMLPLSMLTVNSMRLQRQSLARVEMAAFAEAKLGELRARALANPVDTASHNRVALGGSLTTDVTGHFDQVISTGGRRYQRRWTIAAGPVGTRRVTVGVQPLSGALPRQDYTVYLLLAHRTLP